MKINEFLQNWFKNQFQLINVVSYIKLKYFLQQSTLINPKQLDFELVNLLNFQDKFFNLIFNFNLDLNL